MSIASELIRKGDKETVWKKYCGYLDLSNEEYMDIQERLLIEQINIIKDSKIGKHFFGNKPPKDIEQFREKVPLTTYAEYKEFLMDQKTDALPEGDYYWARTSGRSGEYTCKWVPFTEKMYEKIGEGVLTAMIFASATYKGDVQVDQKDVILLATAPRPYLSSYVSLSTDDLLDVVFIPSLEEGEKMEFGERLAKGFSMGMKTGIDYFYGIASILSKMGERFEQGGATGKISIKMLHPSIIGRYIKGSIAARIEKRKLLPRDLWNIKGIMTGGSDTDIYKERVKAYWGKEPLEGYGCTEGGMPAVQSWNANGMTFIPDIDFYEFISLEEHMKNKKDTSYTPKTLLMDELTPGVYEIVMTNFHGGALMRYRIGDLFEVMSIGDEELGCALPQFRFFSRCDDYLDLGNLVRFTEKTIWFGLEQSGIEYVEWTARKEIIEGEPILHVYVELKESEKSSLGVLEGKLHQGLQKVSAEFESMDKIVGDGYLKVTTLPSGAFENYLNSQMANGADLAHIKIPHMQPEDDQLEKLFKLE